MKIQIFESQQPIAYRGHQRNDGSSINGEIIAVAYCYDIISGEK